jgi:hypothetical protein
MPKKPMTRMNDEEVKQLRRFDSIFRNNGYDPETDRHITIKDALDIQNAAFLIPRVMTQIVQEGIEPLLIGTSLLTKIDYVPGMQTVFPAIEPLRAEEIGDNMGLPIYNINVAGAQTFGTTVKRHGLGLKISKRYIEESTYPWMNMWMRMAGNALARHKEEYIFNFITQLGQCVFNNSVAARTTGYTGVDQPVKGATTGRNIKGQLNGSMTVDDIFDMYAQLLLNGFIPDTMLVHPMAWLMWVKDPVLREFAIQSGGGSFFANWTGNVAVQSNQFYNFGGLGQGTGQSGTYAPALSPGGQISKQEGIPQQMTSAPVIPNYLGLPFRILVSPFMRFDPVLRNCDILMFNSKNLGALIVDEEPHVKSFEDSRYGIQEMHIEETYGFGILNDGLAIGTAKNVRIAPNEFTLPARSVFNISESSSTFEDLGSASIFGGSPLDVNSR